MLQAIESLPLATLLRGSGTAYLLVNTAHILGIALLIGSILPLDLRLAGAFRRTPLPVIAPLLRGTALVGLTLAVLTGLALFSANPVEYAGNTAFRIKLALLAAALLNAVLVTRGQAWAQVMSGASPPPAVRVMAALSALLWLSILLAGRWIGFL